MKRIITAAMALVGSLAVAAGPATVADDTVYIADVIELSGNGATVGNNWKNAVEMAADHINADGGILGWTVKVEHFDTQSKPGVSRAAVRKALDRDPYVLLGPIYSSSTKVNMALARRAQVPQIVGSEAAVVTEMGNPYIFRTSFGQETSMQKLANYMADEVQANDVAVIWVNNDFGKGGRDAIVPKLEDRGIDVVADISTEVGQADFGADISRIKQAGADAVFAYMHEEESARFLRGARKQDLGLPLIGETTLMNQKVIELAGDAANGVRGHVSLTTEAPLDRVAEFREAYVERFDEQPDHNAIKGYIALHVVKEITERMGEFDSQRFAKELHGATITPEQEPGVLMEATWDANGDIDRQSFLIEVVDGEQKIVDILPKVGE